MNKVVTAAIVLLAAASASAEQTWSFSVFLDDKAIGEHNFRLQEADGQQLLETNANFEVKFLFIKAFSYEHRNREVWEDGCLIGIDAETDSNGKQTRVEGERNNDGLAVVTNSDETRYEGCIRSFAYWNPGILESDRLLNAQTGELETVTATRVGEELIEIGSAEVLTERYRLATDKGDIHLWYTKDSQRWIRLDAPAKGDRRIRYEPQTVPDLAVDGEMLAEMK